jgi:hypothetical protein
MIQLKILMPEVNFFLFKQDQFFPKTWDTSGSIISLHKKMDIDQ